MREPVHLSPTRADLKSILFGATAFTIFGSAWLLGGLSMSQNELLAWHVVCAVLPALALLFMIWQQQKRLGHHAFPPTTPAQDARTSKIRRAFLFVNIGQYLALSGLVSVCLSNRWVEWITPIGSLIVGMHFFALVPLYRRLIHAVIGMLICAVVVLTLIFLPQHNVLAEGHSVYLWGAVIGIANGVILLLSAVAYLLRLSQALRDDCAPRRHALPDQ